MGKDFYKGGYRAMIDGAPVRLAFKLSPHALSIMREGCASRGSAKDLNEAMAESYARWLAARDGVSLTAENTIKAIAVWEVPEGKSWKERRIAAVRFEVGFEERGSYYSGTPTRWNCEEVLATIAIPHWDHEPTLTASAVRETAAAPHLEMLA